MKLLYLKFSQHNTYKTWTDNFAQKKGKFFKRKKKSFKKKKIAEDETFAKTE